MISRHSSSVKKCLLDTTRTSPTCGQSPLLLALNISLYGIRSMQLTNRCLKSSSSRLRYQHALTCPLHVCAALPHQDDTYFNVEYSYAFFLLAAFAFATFFRLLLIITTLKNDPTTAEPSSVRITGMRIAHTRGGKRLCRGWPSSTKG